MATTVARRRPHAASLLLLLPVVITLSGCIRLGLPSSPSFYERVANEPGEHAHALVMRGDELMQAGEFAKARRHYARAAQAAPDNALPYIGMVRADLEAQNHARALRVARQARALFAADVEVQLLEATALMSTGQLSEAAAAIDAITPVFDQHRALIARARGDLAYRSSNYSEAMELWRASLAIDPIQKDLDRRIQSVAQWLAAQQ